MKLSPRSLILLAVSEFGGTIAGRTLLQKRLYFLEELLARTSGQRVGFQFDSHFYGPFSPLVGDEIDVLKASGFLRCHTEPFGYSHAGFEVKRYTYELTSAGKHAVERMRLEHPDDCRQVSDAIARIKELGDVNYVDLSIAAKTYFMVKRSGSSMTAKTAVEEAKRYSWQVQEPDVERCFDLLERLDLVKAIQVPAPAGIS